MTQLSSARLGDTVLYRLNAADAEQINRRRADASRNQAGQAASGYVVHVGNSAAEGQQFPAKVVNDWGGKGPSLNLQVFLDGNDTYWASSRIEGEAAGQWSLERPDDQE